jgi:hypothetical protein
MSYRVAETKMPELDEMSTMPMIISLSGVEPSKKA